MDAAELIKHHEGLRLRPYRCTADKLTIGYGRNIQDSGISRDEAEQLLLNDLDECRRVLVHQLPYWGRLGKVRQAVLLNMCFNLGWPRLSKFRNMFNALALEDYSLAGAEMMDSRWANRAAQLIKMMDSGQWPKDLNA